MNLTGRTALVTGATRGVGRELALALARAGADVAVLGRDAALGAELAAAITALGRQSWSFAADVTDEAAMRALDLPAIDILITAAGVGAPRQPVLESSAATYRQVFDVNLLGVMLAAQAVLPGMMARKRGRIIAIGGTYGHKGAANFALYSASKWAVRGLIRSIALEAAPYGITANLIAPGGIEGPQLTSQMQRAAARDGLTIAQVQARFLQGVALGRLSTAADIAAATLFLAGDGARNITGQDFIVDGGNIV